MGYRRWIVPASYLLLGLTVLGLTVRFGERSHVVLALFGLAGLAILARSLNRRLTKRLIGSCTEADFLQQMGEVSPLKSNELLRARLQLARELGVGPEQLAPQAKLGELVKLVDFLGSGFVGLDNIEWLLNREDLESSRSPVSSLTVGEAVKRLAILDGSDSLPR